MTALVHDDRAADPRRAVAALAASGVPYLLGVRHHSPALAVALPALLDAADVEVVCVELPSDFQPWLEYLADPATIAPVALAGSGAEGRLGFYPFADFSPELVAVRWAWKRGAEVICCDLPLSDPGWHAPDASAGGSGGAPYARGLSASGTGREGDDMWDRAVEVLAPGCPPEAVRRAALGVGWALRRDAEAAGGVPASDLAREAHMRRVLAGAAAGGRRVAAVVGAFHAPALVSSDPPPDPAVPGTPASVTSLVPYAFDLLDSRSGYPAGIRDPRWQQAVFAAGGDPDLVRDGAARAITDVCRELRAAGHTAGTGEAVETLRLACDLARLRGLPAPGRGELLEAVTTVLGQGEPLGRGRALAQALDKVLVGAERGRTAPGTPRSGLGPAVEAELAALRLPCPDNPEPREVRLDPLRSDLDARREVALRRLVVCGVGYGEPVEVAGTGDGTALSTRWRLAWTPAVPALLDLAGVRGVTLAQAAAGTLRENFRRESAEAGPTCALILDGLRAAARCDLPELVADRLSDAADALPAAATLAELLDALDLLEALRREHLPGTTPEGREHAAELAGTLLDAAVRALPGLAGSDQPEDAAALVALAGRAGEERLGLRMDDTLAALARSGSPLIQGAALAARVLLDLDGPDVLGARAAGWVDTATDADGRRRLSRLLSGVLAAAAPLLQSAPAALGPLMDRVDALADKEFLDRLPALRGGFDTLAPAGRARLLNAVSERLGDRLDVALDAPPALLAMWAAADAAGLAALRALRLPLGEGFSDEPGASPETRDRAADASLDTRSRPPKHPDQPADAPQAPPGDALPEGRPAVLDDMAAQGLVVARRFRPADRWRLLLGRESDRLPASARSYARALDELYGAGRGEGANDFGPGQDEGGNSGGRCDSFPTAREWAEELEALFGTDVREEVLARAAEAGRTDVLDVLDPAAVRPSVELLTSVLTLAGGLPEQRLAKLRPLVRHLVAELTRELATRLRPALSGLATPRPTRRPGGRLDLPRTLRANLSHTRRMDDGSLMVVPERPVFSTRARKEADWRLILVVDVSGSMEASVIWSALTAAVLAGVPTLSTHFLSFSTQVIDLTGRVADPLSLLLEVQVGGGTHIAAGLAHARSLVTVPSRTLVVVVSDFEEGYPIGGLLAEVRSLAGSGVHLLGCAALDDSGVPRYSIPVAQQLVAAGMPVAALSPLALARWVGDRLRGEAR
ncbi:vWA domain-containing protein [Nonomuraea sp. bgisy101]|uniref:vWA domain-containing protein n=1 Tax=Nonomuraea sp. bgisy101 TaxID=3413784 RepID=UPI003D71F7D7